MAQDVLDDSRRDLPTWRRLRRRAYGLLARHVLAALRILPDAAGRAFCRGLARIALRIRGRERRRAEANLQRVFPTWDGRRRRDFLAESAAALGETLHATLAADRQAAGGFPDVRDGDDTLAACRGVLASGHGAILLTGHIGCWELLGAWLAHHLGGLGVVTGTIHNREVDDLVQARRRALGMTPLPRHEGLRPVLRQLAAGRMVGVLLDQRTGAASVAAPFFGVPAPTPVVVARLALRRGVPVLPAAMAREAGTWVVRHLAPLDPIGDEVAFTRRCNEALETLIRRNPTQWVWFHDRWGST